MTKISDARKNAYAGDDEPQGFYSNTQRRPEIIHGLAREGQIIAMGGDYGVGKSPFMVEIQVCLLRGIPMCGHEVTQRPVIAFDFESEAASYKRNLLSCADRHRVRAPVVPSELEAYLQNGDPHEQHTAHLLKSMASKDPLELVREALARKPNAMVFIDPPEVMMMLNTVRKIPVLKFYHELRMILSNFPHAAFWLTFNMRKKDRKRTRANLLTDPRAWLEEI